MCEGLTRPAGPGTPLSTLPVQARQKVGCHVHCHTWNVSATTLTAEITVPSRGRSAPCFSMPHPENILRVHQGTQAVRAERWAMLQAVSASESVVAHRDSVCVSHSLSEVPGVAGHVQDPENAPQVCAGPQGPRPAVPG